MNSTLVQDNKYYVYIISLIGSLLCLFCIGYSMKLIMYLYHTEIPHLHDPDYNDEDDDYDYYYNNNTDIDIDNDLDNNYDPNSKLQIVY